MTVPQQLPQPSGTRLDPFEEAMRDMERTLGTMVSREPERGLPDRRVDPAPTRPPAVAVAPAPAAMWGPSTTPVTTPLTLLVDAADSAHSLLDEVRRLAEAVTGEALAPRTREAVKLPRALLPAVAQLAHEIEVAHAEIARQVASLRGSL